MAADEVAVIAAAMDEAERLDAARCAAGQDLNAPTGPPFRPPRLLGWLLRAARVEPG